MAADSLYNEAILHTICSQLGCAVEKCALTEDIPIPLPDEPNVVVLVGLLGADPVSVTAEIRQRNARAAIVWLLPRPRFSLAGKLQALGVYGLVSIRDRVATLVEALRLALAGKSFVSPEILALLNDPTASYDLSAREWQVLGLISGGLSNKDVAQTLHLSEKTVSTHKSNIKKKLGFSGDNELYNFALLGFHNV